MKPAPFDYHAPRQLAEAADLLAKLPNAKILAGGQSLVPMMNFRYVVADHLVDVGGIEDLHGILAADGKLRIGAMTRQRELELSAGCREALSADGGSAALCGPSADAQSRHHRRQSCARRSCRRTAGGLCGLRCRGAHCERARASCCAVSRICRRLHDDSIGVRRNDCRDRFSDLAARPWLWFP